MSVVFSDQIEAWEVIDVARELSDEVLVSVLGRARHRDTNS